MKRTSEFVKNKAMFGGYPTQETVNLFENLGVRYFVDLTCSGEKHITKYNTKYTYIHYPIYDHRVPSNWKSFSKLIVQLSNIISSLPTGEKMYIHCKGGHGRSGLVVACILCHLYKITPSDSISKTTEFHNLREEMREKYRKIGSPQTRSQKHFVTKFFEPLYVSNRNYNYFSYGFSNTSNYSVKIPEFGEFTTAQKAYKAFMYSNYSQPITDSSEPINEDAMYTILSYKFKQNTQLTKNLLNTGLRPIIVLSENPYWGKHRNILGKIITRLREELYME